MVRPFLKSVLGVAKSLPHILNRGPLERASRRRGGGTTAPKQPRPPPKQPRTAARRSIPRGYKLCEIIQGFAVMPIRSIRPENHTKREGIVTVSTAPDSA